MSAVTPGLVAICVLLSALASGGCVRVRAHQRALLAAPAMRAPVWPAIARGEDHVFIVREGTAGGSTAGGGGCGCN